MLVFIVFDKLFRQIYTEIMIELLKMRNKSNVNSYHGMMKMKTWSVFVKTSSHDLINRRCFDIVNIVRNAHVVSEIDSTSHISYINHCIDWEQYNILYESNFLKQKMKTAERIQRQVRKKQYSDETVC